VPRSSQFPPGDAADAAESENPMTQAYIFCKVCKGIVAQFSDRSTPHLFKCPLCGVEGPVVRRRNWDGNLATLKRYLVAACINSNSGYIMMRDYGWVKSLETREL